MPNWHEVPDNRRDIELRLRVDTNMKAAEIGDLLDALCVAIDEFGKEGIEMPRYENIHLRVLDPGGFCVVN